MKFSHPLQPPQRQRRAGASLTELVIALTLAAVVLGISASLIRSLFNADRGAALAIAESTNLARLSRIFRQDVHAATTVESVAMAAPLGQRLTLSTSTGEVIRYETVAKGINRIAEQDGQPPHREFYRLPELTQVVFLQEEPNRCTLQMRTRLVSSEQTAAILTNQGRERRLDVTAQVGWLATPPRSPAGDVP